MFNAPIDVQFGEHDVVQPDLVAIFKNSDAVVTRTRIRGPPDLIVEILSPSTSDYDTTLKRQLYEQSGVREYWIVDPEEYLVTQLVLKDGKFERRETEADHLTLAILPDITIPIQQIFSR